MRLAADIVLPPLVQAAKVQLAGLGVGAGAPGRRGERLAPRVPKVPDGKGDGGIVAATLGLERAVDNLDPVAAVRVARQVLAQLVAAGRTVGGKGPREERGAGGIVGEGGLFDGGEAVGVGLACGCQVQRHFVGCVCDLPLVCLLERGS